MTRCYWKAYILFLSVIAAAFVFSNAQTENAEAEEIITVNVKAWIIKDESGKYSSVRSEENVRQLFAEANRIWEHAGIKLNVTEIEAATVNYPEFIHGIYSGHAEGLPYDGNAMNAYFVGQIDANGIAFYGIRSLMVNDHTTVNTHRTLAHEIGHLLTLPHTQDSTSKLMYRGANGELLTEQEIRTARAMAKLK